MCIKWEYYHLSDIVMLLKAKDKCAILGIIIVSVYRPLFSNLS